MIRWGAPFRLERNFLRSESFERINPRVHPLSVSETRCGFSSLSGRHVKLISKPRLPLSNDCTQVTKESKLLCLYFIKQQKYSNSQFNLWTRCDLWFLKIHLSGWIAEQTDSRNLALDSAWSSGSIISQSGFPQWIASRSDLADSVSL